LLVNLLCHACTVRHICHAHGNVNHEQVQLCMNCYIEVDYEKRPKTKNEITFRDE
jgi:hypothetical protein